MPVRSRPDKLRRLLPPQRRRPSRVWLAVAVSLLLHGAGLPILPQVFGSDTAPPAKPTTRITDLDVVPARPLLRRRQPRRRALAQRRQPVPKPPPPKPQPKLPQQPVVPQRLKAVEVDNPESERAPQNARFLSDKNRQVERETRARQRTLIRQKVQQQTSPKRVEAVDSAAERRSPKSLGLRMRPRAERQRREQLSASSADGELPQAQRRQVERALDHQSHDRIYRETAARDRDRARRLPSVKSPRRAKWERVRAALENFVPEVQPGNQTALGTRANPFAVYIARMHRRIHQLWGFGFLVDLDGKADANPLNDMSLWTMVEVVVGPDGQVKKATVVKPSGVLTFDAAALDVVFSAAPFGRPPPVIHSRDGNVYLHWRFHRNHRQCGTFGVDPYILTKPPQGPIDADLREVGVASSQRPTSPRRLNRPAAAGFGSHAMHRHAAGQSTRSTTKLAAGGLSLTAEQRRQAMATLGAFALALRDGDLSAMVRRCRLPFYARGRLVAKSHQQLRRVLADLVGEARGKPVQIGPLMGVAAARRAIGYVPVGATYDPSVLIGRVNLADTPLTAILRRHKDGKWQVIDLQR
ncbi:MAG: TonB family protein [Deltaproteobacteria bacterium]|nr:TonB family protein [Deltaproteobacteria bacterium]